MSCSNFFAALIESKVKPTWGSVGVDITSTPSTSGATNVVAVVGTVTPPPYLGASS
jgi:hypothetical protein